MGDSADEQYLARTAAAAGITVEELIRFEAGGAVSRPVAERLAEVMCPDATHRRHFLDLAGYPEFVEGEADAPAELVKAIEGADAPAAVLSFRWDVMAANTEYTALCAGLEIGANAAEWLFGPDGASLVADSFREFAEMAARLRFLMARHPGDTKLEDLLQRCGSRPGFRRTWNDPWAIVDDRAVLTRRVRQPVRGRVVRLTELYSPGPLAETGLRLQAVYPDTVAGRSHGQ